MSIRLRLVLSYVAMLLVPLVLSGLAVILIVISTLGSIKNLFDVDFSQGNPIKRVVTEEADIFADIKAKTENQPDQLLDAAYIQGLDTRLHKINMGLIIRREKELTYLSPNLKEGEKTDAARLPGFGSSSGGFQHNQNSLWITRQQDFLFSDKSKGSVFIFLDGSLLQKYLHRSSSALIFVFIGILVVTNGVLTYLVSRSIIRPLKALKQAAVHIKEGNLDFEVTAHSDDELGQLSIAFEEMRRRLKQSVEMQLQYEENRKELISNISHDLKTPVTAIKGYVEGIMDGVTNSPDKLDRYLKTIYNKASDMDRLIDELFLFSKLDLGKVPFQFEEVDAGRYVQDCAQELQVDMEKKGIRFVLQELPASSCYITADREKLKRVLLNVIENAVKYSGEADSVIRMGMKDIDGKAVIQIEDNGQGIPEEALPHIFERFYRADPSRNSSTGGSGLGLAIAKQIIEEHGGMIWASSHVGIGTTVYIALPISRREERSQA
ncbi:sensor histidine kinase [Paenibacillus hexagrammi]|uniref:histidine kinase n=1 Tax=Paenibacillus hexagrammi TaxID=2908839 RepID=A0ABY3SM33_9BACL|nr:HAMP domain-containing sensor histidine kinase [Paenibacillus sp. YPD9-1]UJF34180.1 HAMP domain-containing histidine kinase [Paenibacillus sp. YPD9-1]